MVLERLQAGLGGRRRIVNAFVLAAVGRLPSSPPESSTSTDRSPSVLPASFSAARSDELAANKAFNTSRPSADAVPRDHQRHAARLDGVAWRSVKPSEQAVGRARASMRGIGRQIVPHQRRAVVLQRLHVQCDDADIARTRRDRATAGDGGEPAAGTRSHRSVADRVLDLPKRHACSASSQMAR